MRKRLGLALTLALWGGLAWAGSTAPDPIKTDTGFERLLAQLIGQPKKVGIGIGGTRISGRILAVSGEVVTLRVSVERAGDEIVYIPVSRIDFVAMP